MAKYLIKECPYYRDGVLTYPGEVAEIPDGVRPPKGAELVDGPAPEKKDEKQAEAAKAPPVKPGRPSDRSPV